MATTPRGVPYPAGTDPNNVPAHLQSIAEWIDQKVTHAADLVGPNLKPGSVDIAALTGGPWQSYTPTWKATTTHPTLGNGALVGWYTRIGRLIVGNLELTIGPTTNTGAGIWDFSLPVAPARATVLGTWQAVRSGVGYYNGAGGSTSAALMRGYVGGGTTTLLTPTTPFAWAASDTLKFEFSYEAAS